MKIDLSKLEKSSPEEVLKWAVNTFSPKIGLANSLGSEDMVLLDMLAKLDFKVKIFTLDTGRLHQETYDLIEKVKEKYDFKLDIYYPDNKALEKITSQYGPNLFYKSVKLRKLCCNVRKLEPLRRALSDFDAWICGLRKAQSVTRAAVGKVENDHLNGIIKVNPLADWSEKQVWDYIRDNNVPYNSLHDRHFPSIGCLPCTRAISEGEDIRAGRWWWEEPESKECGLHSKKQQIKENK